MKYAWYVLFLCLGFNCNSFAQITSRTLASANNTPQVAPYDSNHNYIDPGKYAQCVGQEIYILPYTQAYAAGNPDKVIGYENFGVSEIAPGNMQERLYKPIEKKRYDFTTNAKAVSGKYFKIIDFIDHTGPQYNTAKNGMFLKLEAKDNNDIVYYYLGANKDKPLAGPFLFTGFYEKRKKSFIGVKVIAQQNITFATDANTGKPVPCPVGSVWTISDVTVVELKNETYMSLAYIFKNDAGNEIAVAIKKQNDGANVTVNAFASAEDVANAQKLAQEKEKEEREKQTKDEEERIQREKQEAAIAAQQAKDHKAAMIKKYGNAKGTVIAAGNVQIGMTKQMCIDAWGEPEDVNKTTLSSGVHEQWVYSTKSYLYFDNGVLTSIQN